MLSILLLTLIAAVVAKIKTKSWDAAMMIGMLGFVIGLIIAVVGGLITGYTWSTEKVVDHTLTLHALGDSDSASGSFFLGSGQIDSDPMLDFYYKDERGSLEYAQVPNDRLYVDIFEEDRQDAIVEVSHYRVSSLMIRLFFFDLRSENKYYSFHIPHNTVHQGFVIDLE